MVRASVTHYSTVSVELPYQASLSTAKGDHRLEVPLDGALSMYYALKDLLIAEGKIDAQA